MISILVPVYKFDVQNLVRQIYAQIQSSGIEAELIVLDDGSGIEWETLKQEFSSFSFLSNPTNKGRSFSRNRLVQLATYENLIFLDCDVELGHHPDWLKTYARMLQSDKPAVYYGSCVYPSERPEDAKFLLHWLYGHKKENPALEYRRKHPVSTFHTVNFACKRSLCILQPFDEQLSRYGHEDSLWARQISERGIPIIHIQNPVTHLGLHNHRQFLRNTAASVKNSVLLIKKGLSLPSLLNSWYIRMERIRLTASLYYIYRLLERRIVRNLLGSNPNLYCLTVFKMGLMLRFSKVRRRAFR